MTTRWPLRLHGPSSACWYREPAICAASEPSGRTTQTCCFTPPSVAMATASHSPSDDHDTRITGSSESAIRAGSGSWPSTTTSCTKTSGVPCRSLTKATRRAFRVMVGPHDPQAAVSRAPRSAAALVGDRRLDGRPTTRRPARLQSGRNPRSPHPLLLQPHLDQAELPERVRADRGPGAVRVLRASARRWRGRRARAPAPRVRAARRGRAPGTGPRAAGWRAPGTSPWCGR